MVSAVLMHSGWYRLHINAWCLLQHLDHALKRQFVLSLGFQFFWVLCFRALVKIVCELP